MNETVRSMYINGRLECTSYGCKPNEIKNANSSEVHFALDAIKEINRPNLKVLNLGLGCGFTLSAIAQDPNVARVDVVEINPIVVKASHYFNNYTASVLKNPKVKLYVTDGYDYLLKGNKKKYDLIISDVENPAIAESSKLYTLEFYEIVKKSLSKDGIFALWAYRPIPNIQVINYNTLSAVFAFVTVKISGPFDDIYFFAKNSLIHNIKLKRSDKKCLEDLKQFGIRRTNTINNSVLTQEWITTGLTNE